MSELAVWMSGRLGGTAWYTDLLHETKDPHLAACPRNSPNTWDMIILFTKGINISTSDLKIKDKVLTLVSIIQEKVFRSIKP